MQIKTQNTDFDENFQKFRNIMLIEVRNICCQTYGVIAYVFISFILSRIVSYVELLQESVTTIRAIICKTLL